MRRRNTITLILVLILTGLALTGILVRSYDAPVLGHKGRPDKALGLSLGLDLSGGTHLVYEADLTKKAPDQTDEEAMAGVLDKIERRVNAYGVSEPVIQKQGANRVSVELPGIRNISEAIDLIGSTAELKFVERTFDSQGNPVNVDSGLTGKDLKRAFVGTHPDPVKAGQPVVHFEFQSEAAQKFADVTAKIFNQNGLLAIVLDDEEISAPSVKEPITGGSGFIEGSFTLDEARRLAIQLNEGSLPVPLNGPIVREDVDPTLGRDSINKSLIAGLIGLGMVMAFMVLFYRLPGVMSAFALIVYAILMLTAFKMVPVTLTLAAIAAFILSIGMAVDANVLIFERLKEELAAGRTLGGAIDIGFNRAWSAIRDSNVSTLITCAILYWLGSAFGEARVMGFALTLGIGVVLSMLSAIVVTRNLLRFFVGSGVAKRLSLFGVSKPEAIPQIKEHD